MSPLPENIDSEKLAEVALAILSLTVHGSEFGSRAWKGLDWELLDLLCEKGWIYEPKGKTKSVSLTKEGEKLCFEYFEKYFSEDASREDNK